MGSYRLKVGLFERKNMPSPSNHKLSVNFVFDNPQEMCYMDISKLICKR